MAVVLGVDSSTQSTKVVACDLDSGAVVAEGSAPHPPTAPPVSEQDPRAWWDALTAAVGALGAVRNEVVAMAVAGQQHGLVLLDAAGDPVRPAKLWNDTTSAAEAAALVDVLGADGWAQACGSVPLASFTIAKLAWVVAHEPDALGRAQRVMLPHDYLTWRLTGAHVTDRATPRAPGGSAHRLDLSARSPSRRLPLPTGSSRRSRPCSDRPSRPAASSPSAAAALGLPAEVVVRAGTGDNMAAALGLGLRPGDVAMSLGSTSGTVYSVAGVGTNPDSSGHVAGFADAAGGHLPLVCTLNATRVTDTVAGWLGTDAAGLSALACAAPAGFDGVILVPYFDGERTPNRPDATGSFLGLRTTTGREALARAAHDGVLCGLYAGLDALRSAGVSADGRIHLIGGGARSAAYRQRCADLAGESIVVPQIGEAVAQGAAVQAAAVAGGVGIGEVVARWASDAAITIDPVDPEGGAAVRAGYTEVGLFG
ncbi:MAG: xylulokinase [Acidimicrobiales bacterium]